METNDIMYKHNIALDMVRICACLMVTFCHIGIFTNVRFDVGAKGVQTFFVLSGYLAILSVSKKKSAKEYFIKRAKTVMPEYYFALVLIWIFEGVVLQGIIEKNFCGLLSSTTDIGLQYLRYFLMLQCIIPSRNWLYWNNLYGLWTMSAFALFYLLVPLIYKLCSKCKVCILPVIGIAFLLKNYGNQIGYAVFSDWGGVLF